MRAHLLGLLFSCVVISAPTAWSACVPPPPGLLAWWRGDGTTLDSAGTNDAFIMASVPFAAGKSGLAFFFNGHGDNHVVLPSHVFPVPINGASALPVSFEVWFKTEVHGAILGQQSSAPFDPPAGYVPALYVGTNGLLYASFFWSHAPLLSTTDAVNDGQWHHAVVTHDGSSQTLYLDGTQIDSAFFFQVAYATNYHYQLGTAYTGGWPQTDGRWFPFHGWIDEASVYARALTAAEVAALHAAGADGKCAPYTLLHRYSFNEPADAGLALRDSRGRAPGTVSFGSNQPPMYSGGAADGSGLSGTGQLLLHGTSGYGSLPLGVSQMSAVTFETWFSWNSGIPTNSGPVFSFGSPWTEIFGLVTNLAELTFWPAAGILEYPRLEVRGPLGLTLVNLELVPDTRLGTNIPIHLVIVYDPPGSRCLVYINGTLTAQIENTSLPALVNFQNGWYWLGRSLSDRARHFPGALEEFRVWNGELPAQVIAQHYAAGPNQSLGMVQPWLQAHRVGNTIELSWPAANASGYEVQTTTLAYPRSWVTVPGKPMRIGERFKFAVPPSPGPHLFRLRAQ